MYLSGLSGWLAFDAVGEPATLAQPWTTWKAKFESYVTASGVSDATQKRALLLHLAGPRVQDIFNISIPAEVRGGAKDFVQETQNTVEMMIEDKPINVIIDSGANCSLMSEGVFEFVKGVNASWLECDKRVYAYASNEPLPLRGKCNLIVKLPQTYQSLIIEVYIRRDKAATLLGRDTPELLGVLRVGVPINSCELKHDAPRETEKLLSRQNFQRCLRVWGS